MAVRFDAAGDEANRSANLPANGAFTYMIWAVLDTDRGTTNYQPVLFALDSGFTSGYSLGLISNVLDLEVHTSGGTTSSFMASRPAFGTPACFFMRSTGTGANQFSGGYRTPGQNSFVTSQGTLGGIGAAANLYVGGVLSTYWTDGRKWGLKVWDRALSDAEILIESFHRDVKFPASLNLWAPLDNHSDLGDRSGNSRVLTAVGTLSTGVTPGGLWTPSRRIFLPASVVNGTANGVILTAAASMIGGAASAGTNGSASGQTLTATASLVPGSAAGVRSPTAAGQVMAAVASLIRGGMRLEFRTDGVRVGGTATRLLTTDAPAPTMVDGDLDILIAGAGTFAPDAAPTILTPAGFDLLAGPSASLPLASGALNTTMYVFGRKATGPGSTVELEANVPGLWGWARVAYDNPNNLYFGQAILDYIGVTNSAVLPSMTLTKTNAMRLDFISQGIAQVATPPGGNEVVRYNDDLGTDGVTVVDEQFFAAGATGTRTYGFGTATDAVFVSIELHSMASQGSATDGTASGATLTATASLVPGSASAVRSPTQAGFTLTAVASLLAGTATGQTNVTAAGQVLTATASLVPGAASGVRSPTAAGQTLTAVASILAGTADGVRSPTAAGQVLTASASLIPGSASTGTSGNASGQTLTATASLVAGSASAVRSPTAAGQVLPVASSLLAGTATGQRQPTAAGTVLSAVASLIAGTAAGQRQPTATGKTLTAVASLIAGAASADNGVVAPGRLLTVTASLNAGAATGQRNEAAPGVVLPVLAVLVPGIAESLSTEPSVYIARVPAAPRVAKVPAVARLARVPVDPAAAKMPPADNTARVTY